MTPKPEKAWAVFDADGDIMLNSIRSDKFYAKAAVAFEGRTVKDSWEILKSEGHRCHKVKVEVVE